VKEMPVKKIASSGDAAIRVRVMVSGFGTHAAVTAQEVVRCVEIVPDWHLQALSSIRFTPLRPGAEGRTALTASGRYHLDSRSIEVHRFSTKEQFHRMLFHEIGHVVYFTVLDSVQKKKWVTELYPGSRFVTAYAARNASEDFAECYRCYVLEVGELARIPGKFDFMRREVFRGRRPDVGRL
jgi:hypothetical protein